MSIGFLLPDRYLTSVLQIKADWLRAKNVKAMLLDIDNTLASRVTLAAGAEILDWVNEMKSEGFLMHLVTNNWHHAVFETAAHLDLPIVYKSMKPLPFNFVRAMKRLGVSRREALIVGDQVMTDILGAKILKMQSVLVLPLTDSDRTHTKLLRNVEKIVLSGHQAELPDHIDPFHPDYPSSDGPPT
ncbi:MAG: YqeG family HAD IIIA-type phosphatase [Coriobacteriia bacterium]|nr:YqeG family HAD IIIA-type phosphatase [Coriobacteriia bacterium]